jgi:hypothetical protein
MALINRNEHVYWDLMSLQGTPQWRSFIRNACRTVHHPTNLLLLPISSTIHFIAFFSQHSTMTSWSGDEHDFGPQLWHQQSPYFEANFPLKGKNDFSLMREVRSYTPKQTVLWPRCSHGEFCVMQVYEGWNNFGRRF